MVITPPGDYAQWITLLDRFKNREDDEAVLAAMQKGTLAWQAGVAERFARKLIDAVNFRMNAATDRFQKEMTRTRGQERAVVQALLTLRKELSFLHKALDLPVLPQKDRQHYLQLVTDHANEIQRSLEDSAKADRTGKLASIVRNTRVNAL